MSGIRVAGFIRRPPPEEVRALAVAERIVLDPSEATELADIIDGALTLIDELDDLTLPPDFLQVQEPSYRDQGYMPSREEDPFNVFIRKCSIEGSGAGVLAGKTVGLKDNIRVSGVPMTNGSRLVGAYMPGVDAVIVERLLAAGATIAGKLNMDDFSFAGTGETSVFGPALNPINPRYSAGGSSSGAGAAVAAGEVDLAIGVDQGGSGRVPAAWCGVASIKPTHGLIPTFGLTYMDHTLDYVCPLAKRITDVATALQVLAGTDSRDPQWIQGEVRVDDYLAKIDDGVDGLRIGVIVESMGMPVSEPDVDMAISDVLQILRSDGAQVAEVSIPLWDRSWSIWNGIMSHSIHAMIESNLEGYGRRGACDPDWQRAFGTARRSGAFNPSPQLKALLILGRYLKESYFSVYYSKANNLRMVLSQQLHGALSDFDVLVTPTTPMKAFELRAEPITIRNFATRSASMAQNTCPTNLTGHPAATVPSGVGTNGLPVGLQVIGSSYGEALVLRVANHVQRRAILS